MAQAIIKHLSTTLSISKFDLTEQQANSQLLEDEKALLQHQLLELQLLHHSTSNVTQHTATQPQCTASALSYLLIGMRSGNRTQIDVIGDVPIRASPDFKRSRCSMEVNHECHPAVASDIEAVASDINAAWLAVDTLSG